ncbi:MAG: hypothetical protein IJT21_07305 [Synergistaceae bacterium]|nr:hypothetical protein [Synergistaceae bacterium]
MRIAAIILIFTTIFTGTAESKPRVAVRAFEDRTQEQDAPAGAVMDMFVTELDKSGVFELVEREKFKYIAEEIELSQSGLVDPSMVLELGKVHSAQYTITGAITLYYYNEKKSGFSIIIGSTADAKTAYVNLDIRIISNTTSKIVYSSVKQGQAKQTGKSSGLSFKEFFVGSVNKTHGGILALATREAVMQHVSAIKAINWE